MDAIVEAARIEREAIARVHHRLASGQFGLAFQDGEKDEAQDQDNRVARTIGGVAGSSRTAVALSRHQADQLD